jgi:hypothetical protein
VTDKDNPASSPPVKPKHVRYQKAGCQCNHCGAAEQEARRHYEPIIEALEEELDQFISAQVAQVAPDPEEAEGRGISFVASLPMIQSAIRSGGDGSMRITLEVPKSERTNVVPLLALTECVFQVTITPPQDTGDEDEGSEEHTSQDAGNRIVSRSSAKQRVQQSPAGVQ